MSQNNLKSMSIGQFAGILAVTFLVPFSGNAWVEYSTATQTGNFDTARLSLNNTNSGGQLALSNFVLNFENGDHRVATIGAMARDRHAEVTFVDENGDDPFYFQGSWVSSNEFRSGGANYTRSEVNMFGTVTLPAAPVGYERVLRGFYMSVHPGRDRKIRQISVWQSGPNTYRMVLRSDGNLSGVQYVVPRYNNSLRFDPGSAIHNLMSWLLGFGNQAGERKPDSFAAYVYSTLIPRSMVRWTAETSGGNSRKIDGGGRIPTTSETVLLKGFDFTFAGGDTHNLLQLGVQIPYDRNQQAVFFQDNNQDDNIAWRLQYVGIPRVF